MSLHSQEESEILHPFIKNTGESIYIGLVRIKINAGKFYFYCLFVLDENRIILLK